MTCGEVAVARRLGLALPIVVLDDGWLSLIQVKQHRRHLPIYGTETGSPALPTPAHYFGVPAVGVRDGDALAKALRDALSADHPTVIEARVDPAHYLTTVYD
jgi:acetolactate synthase-1/2/3 large subunit